MEPKQSLSARLQPLALPLFVALAAVLVYLNSLSNGFALDDAFIVQKNVRVHDLGNQADIWLTPYWPTFGTMLGLYRPLVIFAFAVQWAIGDGAAWVFHLTNVLLHALVAVLLYQLLRRFASTAAAVAGALVFAVHPLHTEAVANVVGQAELIAAATALAAALVHVTRPGSEVSWPRRAALVILLLAGVLAKESAIILPGLLVLLDFAQRRVGLDRESLVRYARAMAFPLILMALALVAYLLLRFSVLGSITGVDANPAFPYLREQYRLLHAFRAWPEFLRLLVFPADLAADYGPAVVLPLESLTPMAALGLLLLVGAVLLTALTPLHPQPGLVAGWFLISVLTVSNLFFPVGVLIAERTLYLPSAAVAFAVAFLWDASRRAELQRAVRVGALAVVVALMAGRTWVRNPDWASTKEVLEGLIRDHPEAYRSQWVVATDRWRRGEIGVAERHYLLAFRLWPRDSQFLTEYATFHMAQGNFRPAAELLEASRALKPEIQTTHLRLAQAYLGLGRYQDALAATQDALQHGGDVFTRPLRGEALQGLGRYDQAAAEWRVALARKAADRWYLWAQLARSLGHGGHLAAATTAADSAARFAPTDSTVRRVVAELEAAVRSGCLSVPDGCPDPLAGWSVAMGPPADSARILQNARERAAAGAAGGGPR